MHSRQRAAAGLLGATLLGMGAVVAGTAGADPSIIRIEAERASVRTVGVADGPGWNLWSAGQIGESVTFGAGPVHRLTVRARANSERGVEPMLEVRIDGTTVGRTPVRVEAGWGYRDYQFDVSATPGRHDVVLAFTNDPGQAGNNVDLIVDYFTVATTEAAAPDTTTPKPPTTRPRARTPRPPLTLPTLPTTTAPALTLPTVTTTTAPALTTTRPTPTTTRPTTTTTPPPPPPSSPPTGDDFHPSGYTLEFSDEFDGTQLDRGQWCTRYIYSGGSSLQRPDSACTDNGQGNGTLDFLNDEQQRYVDTNTQGRTMHEVGNGTLTLWATRTRNDSYARFESAMIRSKRLFRPSASVSYYLTTRVRLPSVVGTWPAFWLNADRSGSRLEWPPEIDIFEAALNGRDDRVDMLHQGAIFFGEGRKQNSSGKKEITYQHADFDSRWNNFHAPQSLRDNWIEVGLLWTEDSVCYYIDGLRTMCENYKWVYNDGSQAAPAHVLLNLAIGGGWAGRYGIDDGRFPTNMQIDHVRVYKK